MNDEIVSRLSKSRASLAIKESLNHIILEADEDEDGEDLTPIEDEPEDNESLEDEEVEDNENEESPEEETPASPSRRSSPSTRGTSAPPKQSPAPQSPEVTPEPDVADNPNPLDNLHAINYKMGDDIALVYSSGSKTELVGKIEGYDKEGFYRVKWNDGRITNGLTDTAIAELSGKTMKESACVCGHNNFVEEDGHLVCDNCGRIKEGADILAEVPKPKKRIIRATPKGVNTANRPDIAESIKAALRDINKK